MGVWSKIYIVMWHGMREVWHGMRQQGVPWPPHHAQEAFLPWQKCQVMEIQCSCGSVRWWMLCVHYVAADRDTCDIWMLRCMIACMPSCDAWNHHWASHGCKNVPNQIHCIHQLYECESIKHCACSGLVRGPQKITTTNVKAYHKLSKSPWVDLVNRGSQLHDPEAELQT